MERIFIKNIGPIKECEFDIKPINIFIGPQATGKSTIAKLVFCFKSFYRDLLAAFVLEEDVNLLFKEKMSKNIGIYLNDKSEARYFFSQEIWIQITCKKGAIEILFCEELNKIVSEILALKKALLENDGLLERSIVEEKIRLELARKLPEVFQKELPIFVPAGRLIYAFLPEPRGAIERLNVNFALEPIMRDFDWKRESMKKFLQEFQDKDNFMSVIEEILKAKIYVREDKIFLKLNGKELPIKFASSGQQELLWVFLTIIYLMLNKKASFVVIEEPEAHLFPATQKEIVEMFALLHNLTNTGLFITTHSPYILTSFNNLIYAYSVASKSGKKEKVSKVVNSNFWLNPDEVNAFYVEGGKIKDIIDEELKVIKAEVIDEISKEINREFEALLDIEVGEEE
jgi:predicted ATPase